MPPSWYENKRKATESPQYANSEAKNGGSEGSGTSVASSSFYKLFDKADNSGSNDFSITNTTYKKPRLANEPSTYNSLGGSQSKLKRPSSSASPRLSSLSEKFAFKPTSSKPSSTVFSRYNSMLGTPSSTGPNSGTRIAHTTTAATAGLDSREEIIAKRLQNVFRTVPLKMINYAVKKMGTFDSAADWLEGQDSMLAKNSRTPSTSSSSRSSPSVAAAASKSKGRSTYGDKISSDSDLEEVEIDDDEDDLISEAARSGFLQAKREVSKPTMSIRQKFSHRSAQAPPVSEDIEEIVQAPKRRLVRAQPVEEDTFISDESDGAQIYDDVEEIEFESRVLDFMNTASVEDIADIAACELSMAQAMADARPFSSLDKARQVSTEANGKSWRKKSIGEKIINAASTVSFHYLFYITAC